MSVKPPTGPSRISRQRILLGCRAAGLVFLGLGMPLSIRFLYGLYEIAAAATAGPSSDGSFGTIGSVLDRLGSKGALLDLLLPNAVGVMSFGMGVYLLKRDSRKIVEWTEVRA